MSGSLGIGTSSPSSRLDIAWGGYQTQGGAVNIGADIGNLTTRTNNTTKYGIISAVPYTTSDKPIELLTYYSNNTEKVLSVGGGGNTDFAGLNSISFLTTSSLTQPGAVRMTVTSAGNVGIGTTGPSASLHITNTSTGVVTDGLMLHNNGNSGTAGNGVRLIFKCGSFITSEYRSYATIEGVTDAANNPSIALVFKTPNYGILFPPNERMRITGGGDVLVGTTTSGILASANGITLNAGGMIYVNSDNTSIFNRSTNSSGTVIQFRYNEATVVGTITITSSTTAYNTNSDYRLKEDLKPINGLEKISALKVYDFKWKSSEDRMDGVLAHELQDILPYAVYGEKDGEDMQGVDYSKIVPVLIKSIQELKSENDTLKEILQRNNIQ
jgi:hypothetical protein